MRVAPGGKTFAKVLAKFFTEFCTPRKIPMAPYMCVMNYLLALLLPPVSILLAGRPIVAVLTFLIWIPALLFSGGLTHPMFILLAWLIIFQAREDRRERYGD